MSFDGGVQICKKNREFPGGHGDFILIKLKFDWSETRLDDKKIHIHVLLLSNRIDMHHRTSKVLRGRCTSGDNYVGCPLILPAHNFRIEQKLTQPSQPTTDNQQPCTLYSDPPPSFTPISWLLLRPSMSFQCLDPKKRQAPPALPRSRIAPNRPRNPIGPQSPSRNRSCATDPTST